MMRKMPRAGGMNLAAALGSYRSLPRQGAMPQQPMQQAPIRPVPRQNTGMPTAPMRALPIRKF